MKNGDFEAFQEEKRLGKEKNLKKMRFSAKKTCSMACFA
jgi:hypothetical protein